jgi:hypothetical protein
MLSVSENINMSIVNDAEGIRITKSKGVSDADSVNMTDVVYTLPASQVAFQEIAKGDIATLRHILIRVATRPDTFAGIGVAFVADSSTPTDANTVISDHLSASVIDAGHIWVKNLDTVAAVTIEVVLTGTNA